MTAERDRRFLGLYLLLRNYRLLNFGDNIQIDRGIFAMTCLAGLLRPLSLLLWARFRCVCGKIEGMIVDYITPRERGNKQRYYASPSLIQGKWMVIAQRHPADPGYGVLGDLPSREAAESEAARLNDLGDDEASPA